MSFKLSADPVIDRAQKLRLQRVLLGSAAYLCNLLIALAAYVAGFLPGDRALHLFIVFLLLNLSFVGLVLSGLNLRLRDPGMTAVQILSALLPCAYVMYYLTDAQVRMAFLMNAVVAMMFGAFRFDLRRMLLIGAAIILSYLALLGTLQLTGTERLNWRAEAIIVFTYSAILSVVAFVGSYISRLRQSLNERNRALQSAMRELHQLAMRDPLTLLPNRTALMAQLEREAARSARQGADESPLCLCMLDVDLFKRINDTYGHQAGDAVLQQVAEALRRSLRLGDFIGRFGGEEFLLILPDTDEVGAARVAERVRQEVAALRVPELPADERVTVSLGVAVLGQAETAEQALARADAALYEAKSQGRDRVALASELVGAVC